MPDFSRGGDGVRVRFDQQEAGILRQLADEMRDLLESGRDDGDDVMERLFPSAYESPSDEAAWRELSGTDLERHKVRLLEQVKEALGERGPAVVELSDDDLSVWLAVLTDLRLAIGTRLGVDEQAMSSDVDPRDPHAPALSVLHWLGWIQEGILRQVM